jgi:hypothetical protein
MLNLVSVDANELIFCNHCCYQVLLLAASSPATRATKVDPMKGLEGFSACGSKSKDSALHSQVTALLSRLPAGHSSSVALGLSFTAGDLAAKVESGSYR